MININYGLRFIYGMFTYLGPLSITYAGCIQKPQKYCTLYSKNHPSTDNAYLQANTIYIASQVNGPIVQLKAANYQKVAKDTLLFEIDPQPYHIAVDKAKADLRLTEQLIAANQAAVETAAAQVKQRATELSVTEKNTKRILTLVKQGQLSKAIGDETQGKLDIAKAALSAAQSQLEQAKQQLGDSGNNNARLQVARAALAKAELDLTHTRIIAPANGTIINLNARIGSMVGAGQPLFAIIEDNVWWVDANFKETQLHRIRPGQPAKVIIDAYPGKTFEGKVSAISQGSGAAFSMLPPENATGNWVKVTQRFPVKVILTQPNPHYPFRVGASCEVIIDTTHRVKKD